MSKIICKWREAKKVMTLEKQTDASYYLTFVADNNTSGTNYEDVFTDVIAFNIENNPFEGEIYISYHRVQDNAERYNQKFQDEFKRVIIHGLLHLCGHEDSTRTEKKNMRLIEDKFLDEFNYSVIQK